MNELCDEVAKFAGDYPWQVTYKVNNFGDNQRRVEIQVYVSRKGDHSPEASTYQGAYDLWKEHTMSMGFMPGCVIDTAPAPAEATP